MTAFVRACAGGILLALAAVFLIAVRAYCSESNVYRLHRVAVPMPSHPPPGLRPVSLSSSDGTRISAWYVPGRTGGGVVLAHGGGETREDMLPEARALAAVGIASLLYDSPGHGESEGEIRWAAPERDAARAAVSWLAAQPGIWRVGAAGFSLGGAIVAQVAAEEPRIRAVALLGTYTDAEELTRVQYHRWRVVSEEAALLADRRHGFQFAALQPAGAIARISPRPLLVVHGERDAVVPVRMGQALFDAATGPRELMRLPACGHGGYASCAVDYPAQFADFFARALR